MPNLCFHVMLNLALLPCRYYHPANLTISVVGDVDPSQVQQLAEKYFGHWTAAPGATTLNSTIQQLAIEPVPRPMAPPAAAGLPVAPLAPGIAPVGGAALGGGAGSSRMFRQQTAAGPLLALGYYRPSVTGRTGTAMEVRRGGAAGLLPSEPAGCSCLCRLLHITTRQHVCGATAH